jgi:hypothetical protein
VSTAGGLEPYSPLGVLKPLGRDIWMVDGPVVRARRLLGTLPLTTRMTVARLPDGRLWLHAPVELTPGLEREIRALGRVAALVLPERFCGAALAGWQAAFPWAVTWCVPGLAAHGLRIDHELEGSPPSAWRGAIAQVLVRGGFSTEAVFLHRASRTLVLSDLVHNFEQGRGRGGLLRRAMRLGGCGGTPPDLWLGCLGRRQEVRAAVETILGWRPDRVVPAHGRPWLHDGTAELRRALAWTGARG